MTPLLLALTVGQLWQWTDPAPHHAAACIVTVRGGASGSGCLVDLGGVRCVLTAAHVVSGATRGVTCRWQDGVERVGDATVDKTGADFAVVLVDRPGEPLEIGDPVAIGQPVEFLGFGHPRRLFRRWRAKRIQTAWGSIDDYDGATVPGDSGGPILDARHRVVGVVTGGNERIGNVEHLPIYRGAVSDTTDELRDFARRVVKYGGQP